MPPPLPAQIGQLDVESDPPPTMEAIKQLVWAEMLHFHPQAATERWEVAAPGRGGRGAAATEPTVVSLC